MEFGYTQVSELLDEISPFLIKGGVSKEKCSMPTGDIHLIKPEKFIVAYDALHDLIMSPEWDNVQKVWRLLPPNIWRNYEMMEFEGFAEQILLTEACNKLKDCWKQLKKPTSFFGKEYKDEQFEC